VSAWLIVGLGNPGAEYDGTRHNAGFMVIDRLAEEAGIRIKRQECSALVGQGEIENASVELAKPQTFMNLSGQAVNCLLQKPERSLNRLLIISDDLAIPFDTIRIRRSGSHGGQNGLRSIIDQLKSQEFARLRIGIGAQHEIRDASRFVLGKFSSDERQKLPDVIDRSFDAIKTVIRSGVDEAMAKFN
jgi:peptidyl-tRNA hydrolase, PTH1 family